MSGSRRCWVHLYDVETRRPLAGIKKSQRIEVNVCHLNSAEELRRQLSMSLRLCPSDPTVTIRELVWIQKKDLSSNICIDDAVFKAIRSRVMTEADTCTAPTQQERFVFGLYADPLVQSPGPFGGGLEMMEVRKQCIPKSKDSNKEGGEYQYPHTVDENATPTPNARRRSGGMRRKSMEQSGTVPNSARRTRPASMGTAGMAGTADTERGVGVSVSASASRAAVVLPDGWMVYESSATTPSAGLRADAGVCLRPLAESSMPSVPRMSPTAPALQRTGGGGGGGGGGETATATTVATSALNMLAAAHCNLDKPDSPLPTPAARPLDLPHSVANHERGEDAGAEKPASSSSINAFAVSPKTNYNNSVCTSAVGKHGTAEEEEEDEDEGIAATWRDCGNGTPSPVPLRAKCQRAPTTPALMQVSLPSTSLCTSPIRSVEKTKSANKINAGTSTTGTTTTNTSSGSREGSTAASRPSENSYDPLLGMQSAHLFLPQPLSLPLPPPIEQKQQEPKQEQEKEQKKERAEPDQTLQELVQRQRVLAQPKPKMAAAPIKPPVKGKTSSSVGKSNVASAPKPKSAAAPPMSAAAAVTALSDLTASASASAAAVVSGGGKSSSASASSRVSRTASAAPSQKRGGSGSSSSSGSGSSSSSSVSSTSDHKPQKTQGAPSLQEFSSSASSSSAGSSAQDASVFSAGAGIDKEMAAHLGSGLDLPGRPSIQTILSQLEFLKQQLGVQGNDEELQWLMTCKKDGAYAYAHARCDDAMESYVRAAAEQTHFEQRLDMLKTSLGPLLAVLAQVTKISPLNAAGKAVFVSQAQLDEASVLWANKLRGSLQQQLVRVAALQDGANSSLGRPLTDSMWKKLQQLQHDLNVSSAMRLASQVLRAMREEQESAETAISSAAATQNASLEALESWGAREKKAIDYESTLQRQDAEWLQQEADANRAALRTMRGLIPVNVTETSISALVARSQTAGVVLPLDLATELKRNVLVQLAVLHPEDIASMNFLSGGTRQVFEAFQFLDVVETRAIAAVLPFKFEHDFDGAKAKWRRDFFDRARALVSQHKGEHIKGGWDRAKGKRAMIAQTELQPEQERRKVYFYPTVAEVKRRIDEYVSKIALRDRRAKELAAAEIHVRECKEEVDIIIAEGRDPNMRAQIGVEKLAKAKNMARDELTKAENARRAAHDALSRVQAAIDSYPQCESEYRAYSENLHLALGSSWSDDTLASAKRIIVPGSFDEEPLIEKGSRNRTAVRGLCIEEEARARAAELASMRKSGPSGEAREPGCAKDAEKAERGATAAARKTPAVIRACNESPPSRPTVGREILALGSALASAAAKRSNGPVEPVITETPKRSPRANPLNINASLLQTLNKMCSVDRGQGQALSSARPVLGNHVAGDALPLASAYSQAHTPLRDDASVLGRRTASKIPLPTEEGHADENENPNAGAGAEEDVSVPVKKSRSRLVKRLMGVLTPPPPSRASPVRMSLAQSLSLCAGERSTAKDKESKGACRLGVGAAGIECNAEDCTSSPRPAARVRPAMGGVSFLDAIKQRCVE